MSEMDITEMLEQKFAPPAWALLPQVRNCTGYARSARTADAIAFSLYPSRGLDMHGIEIKISKADLKREIAEPSKAESIAKYCDYWWLAVPDKKITDGLIIPGAWGIIECKKKAVAIKQAEKQEAKPIDRPQLAAIMRKLYETAGAEAEIQKRLKKEREKIWQEGYDCGKKQKARDRNETERVQLAVEKFKEKTGLDIANRYSYLLDTDYTDICDALRLIEKSKEGGTNIFQLLRYLGRIGKDMSRKAEIVLDEVDEIMRSKKRNGRKQAGQQDLFEESEVTP